MIQHQKLPELGSGICSQPLINLAGKVILLSVHRLKSFNLEISASISNLEHPKRGML